MTTQELFNLIEQYDRHFSNPSFVPPEAWEKPEKLAELLRECIEKNHELTPQLYEAKFGPISWNW